MMWTSEMKVDGSEMERSKIKEQRSEGEGKGNSRCLTAAILGFIKIWCSRSIILRWYVSMISSVESTTKDSYRKPLVDKAKGSSCQRTEIK